MGPAGGSSASSETRRNASAVSPVAMILRVARQRINLCRKPAHRRRRRRRCQAVKRRARASLPPPIVNSFTTTATERRRASLPATERERALRARLAPCASTNGRRRRLCRMQIARRSHGRAGAGQQRQLLAVADRPSSLLMRLPKAAAAAGQRCGRAREWTARWSACKQLIRFQIAQCTSERTNAQAPLPKQSQQLTCLCLSLAPRRSLSAKRDARVQS